MKIKFNNEILLSILNINLLFFIIICYNSAAKISWYLDQQTSEYGVSLNQYFPISEGYIKLLIFINVVAVLGFIFLKIVDSMRNK